jgi:hypothetical protein
MRVMTAAGALIFSTGVAFGAYLVELDGGDRMTVDSFWQEGERMHLVRGGSDLNVPESRVRQIREVSGDDEAGVKPGGAFAAAPRRRPVPVDPERAELERAKTRIERHIVRASKQLSIARARGDSPKTIQRLQHEMDHTWARQREVKSQLDDE